MTQRTYMDLARCPWCTETLDELEDAEVEYGPSKLNYEEMEVSMTGACTHCGRTVSIAGVLRGPSRPTWNHRLVYSSDGDGGSELYLDADPCPNCDSVIFNVAFTEGGQFVGASGRSKKNFEERKDLENEQLYQLDDGGWDLEVVYATCGECNAVLVDDRPDDDNGD